MVSAPVTLFGSLLDGGLLLLRQVSSATMALQINKELYSCSKAQDSVCQQPSQSKGQVMRDSSPHNSTGGLHTMQRYC